MNCLDKYKLAYHLMKNSDLAKSEILILTYLYEHKTGTTNDFSSELNWQRPNVSRLVKQMTDKQLVNRKLDVDDQTYIYSINENHQYFKEFYGKE